MLASACAIVSLATRERRYVMVAVAVAIAWLPLWLPLVKYRLGF